MEFPEPANDYESSGSNFQRIAVGAGAFLVVLLTVVVAIFLTLQDLPPAGDPEAPSVSSPTAVAAVTSTVTPQPASPSAETPSTVTAETTAAADPVSPTPAVTQPEPTLTLTPVPPTPTPLLSTPTFTQAPLPSPTFTPSPLPPPPPPTNTPLSPPQPAPVGECQPPIDWVAYVAQVGDTYSSLAVRTGTSVFELQRVNCPETATLSVGETVYLPTAPAAVPATSTPRPDPERTATPEPLTPEINDIIPEAVDTSGNQNAIIVVLGKNFDLRRVELRAESGTPVIVLPLREQPPSEVSFEAVIPCTLPVGTYDMIVTNANGRLAVREDAVQVVAASLPDGECQ